MIFLTKRYGVDTYIAYCASHKCNRFFITTRAGCSGWRCLLGKSEIACSTPTLALKFQRNKMFLPRSFVKIQYYGEPPWPKGSVFGLRPPGFEFQILCLKGSVISFISPSSHEVLLVQFSLYVHKSGLKPHSFNFTIKPVQQVLQHYQGFVWIHHCNLYPLQGADCCRDTRLVLDEDDLKWVASEKKKILKQLHANFRSKSYRCWKPKLEVIVAYTTEAKCNFQLTTDLTSGQWRYAHSKWTFQMYLTCVGYANVTNI